jgi:hypothetical protein
VCRVGEFGAQASEEHLGFVNREYRRTGRDKARVANPYFGPGFFGWNEPSFCHPSILSHGENVMCLV